MIALLLLALGALAPPPQAGGPDDAPVQRFDPLQDVGIEPRVGERLPLDVALRDHEGRPVRLGDYLGEQPLVLAFVYYRCPMLCTLVLNGVVDALRTMQLAPGEDFQLVVVSIDPRETPELAAEKRQRYLESLDRPGAERGWHFLVGDAAAVEALTETVGFRYVYDAENDQYAHASGIQVATPDGRLSHYLYGVEYSARDLRLALVEASEGTLGTVFDQVLLLCYAYDPTSGQYGLAILTALRVGGLLVLGALLSYVLLTLRRERRRARPTQEGLPQPSRTP